MYSEWFGRKAPAVSSFFVGFENSPLSGGSTATLGGLNFAFSNLTSTATVAFVDCATLSWSSGTSTVCRMAPETASKCELVVTSVASAVGTARFLFTFDGSNAT